MKIKNILVAVLFAIIGTTASLAQMNPEDFKIPVDTAVRTGKLSNGLTYYIRQNGYPEHRVNFYIAQRVGSIQENDDQRGLAHFLEHMAFNGSDHFEGNNLIEYLRSIGVEFGSDLNAYTSVAETVYRICNVPSARVESLDSCLLILKDWSNGLTLAADEIDKERGVIHEEWRLRTQPMMRVLERNLEKLYPNSKYGLRMPIGKMEIIDNFEPEALRKYYQKWYRPDNQAIIVVGDVDVDRTEAKIKELFSGIKLQENAAQVVDEPVPDNNEAIIIVDKDKEQRADLCMLMFKHDAYPDDQKDNIGYLFYNYAKEMASQMLNSRLSEVAQNPDCPFAYANAYDGEFIYAKTKDAFDIDIVPKPGKTEEALAAAMREAVRAVRFGFTETEYSRARSEYLSQLEKEFTNKNKRENSLYGPLYSRNYIDNEPIPSIDYEYQTMTQVTQMIPVQVVNECLKELISQTDTNLVILSVHTEKEGAVYPTRESLKAAIDGVHGEQLTAWVDNVKNEPLITDLPAKGKITGEKENKALGYKELSLSNGAKVILKKTDFKDDEVVMQAQSKGGSSLYGEADYANLKLFNYAIASSGLGEFSNTDLEKAMAGKQASVDFSITSQREFVTGESTPKDLETMFQLTYLKFTNISKDEKSYASLMNLLATSLKNKSLSPDMAFSDSVVVTQYAHNPRFASLDIKDVEAADYDRILQIAKERTADASDFTFYFVGNFDEDSIRPLIEQYIASLPAKGTKEQWKNVMTYSQGDVVNKFYRKMETPSARSRMMWYNNTIPYSLENAVMADAAGQVLDMIYLKKIREEASAAYSASAAGSAQAGGAVPFTYLIGVCPMNPDKSDLAVKIMEDEAKNLGNTVDADMLAKVKELMLKRADEDAKTNSYWIDILSDYDELGIDKYTSYKDIVNGLTPEKVAKFVKDVFFTGANSVKVIMLPEESK
ncbi:MAG: insulinase family protein [Prevotellaceae bacterium]|nr:insulinase family protein [Prevotellaceae bacterium]